MARFPESGPAKRAEQAVRKDIQWRFMTWLARCGLQRADGSKRQPSLYDVCDPLLLNGAAPNVGGDQHLGKVLPDRAGQPGPCGRCSAGPGWPS